MKLIYLSEGTNISSEVVVAVLAIQVFGVWWGTRNDFGDLFVNTRTDNEDHPHKE